MTQPLTPNPQAEQSLRRIAGELEDWLKANTKIGFGEEPRVDAARKALLQRAGDPQ